jgi:hypothetical protein
MAKNTGCSPQTVRDVIHYFTQDGLAARVQVLHVRSGPTPSSEREEPERPRRTLASFYQGVWHGTIDLRIILAQVYCQASE